MSIDDMIAVLQAAKAGKAIEYREYRCQGEQSWFTTVGNEPSWDFRYLEYRVKPEPREWWLELHRSCSWTATPDHTSQAATVHSTKRSAYGGQVIHVREVL